MSPAGIWDTLWGIPLALHTLKPRSEAQTPTEGEHQDLGTGADRVFFEPWWVQKQPNPSMLGEDLLKEQGVPDVVYSPHTSYGRSVKSSGLRLLGKSTGHIYIYIYLVPPNTTKT